MSDSQSAKLRQEIEGVSAEMARLTKNLDQLQGRYDAAFQHYSDSGDDRDAEAHYWDMMCEFAKSQGRVSEEYAKQQEELEGLLAKLGKIMTKQAKKQKKEA